MNPIALTITGQRLTASVPDNRVVQNTRNEYWCTIDAFDEDTALTWGPYCDITNPTVFKGAQAVFYNDSLPHDEVRVTFVLKDDGNTPAIFLPENILDEPGNLRIAIIGRLQSGEILTTEWCDPIPILPGPYIPPILS